MYGQAAMPPTPSRCCAFVKKLRHKLGDSAANPIWIVNQRGVGYLMPVAN